MKSKKMRVSTGIIVLIILYLLYTPSGAIVRHLFFDNPIKSLTCIVKKSDYVDTDYGQQYLIDGFDDIRFAYVKRNSIGLCYWSGGGSGP